MDGEWVVEAGRKGNGHKTGMVGGMEREVKGVYRGEGNSLGLGKGEG